MEGVKKGRCEEEGWLREAIANKRPVLADYFHTLPFTTHTHTHQHTHTCENCFVTTSITERRYC